MPLTPVSRSFISQRLRLHYVDWGNPDAPPIVLVHGGRDHCRNWDFVAERLADRYHVLALDLRGHGDSAWSTGSTYMIAGHIYDLAQLIHQQRLAPVTLIAHSLGGQIAIRYAGVYPETVSRIVAIEGLGGAPQMTERQRKPVHERARAWIEETRSLAAHRRKRYAGLDECVARMREANKKLTPEVARHLTVHGVAQNEDGTFSWKFDPYVRPWAPYDMTREEVWSLWERIACPVLLVWGRDSWHTNPEADGRAQRFQNAHVVTIDGAGHWVHHDQLEAFMGHTERFLAGM